MPAFISLAIGLWPEAQAGRGVAIVEADTAEAVHGFLMMWTGGLSKLEITPVLDDAAARAVIAANTPEG